MTNKCSSILLIIFLTATTGFAQYKAKTNTLKQSIALIDSAFQKDNTEDFNSVMPLKSVQDFYTLIINKKFRRESGTSRVIRAYKDSAYVFLSGIALYGNSGDETNFSAKYTGLYKFERIDGSWVPKSRINIDRENQIKKHQLGIAVMPGKGIKITDTLTLDINDSFGFATKLNHTARLKSLSLNNSRTDYTFSSGLLWVKARIKKNQKLIIEYNINIEKDDKDRNSGYFADAFGHIRNQYFWHPFFSFSSPNDRADFSIYCTIPKAYHLATSLPQKESIAGDLRIIEARSENPTFGLSLYYDKDWEVTTFKKDQIDMVVYATKDFLPKKEVLFAEFSKNYDTLQNHFGQPLSNYFGIVQDRASGNGWKNRSNSIVIAGEKGSILITDKPNPRATFGHEVAHGWTNPTGPATNFLTEGWATYAESLLLSSVYGDSIINKFFESQKSNYINGKYNTNISLWEDYSNSGVSYSKGSWLFYMLANQLGKKNLSAAMTNFIKSGDQSVQSFTNQISRTAGKNMEPMLLGWLKSKEIPLLSIQQSANSLNILQSGDIFIFPLEIKLKLKNGTYLTRIVEINSKEQLLPIKDAEIDSFIIDPDHKVLLDIK